MDTISRRKFIGTAAMAGASLASSMGSAQAPASAPAWMESIPVIDAHIHLFDPTRPVFSGYLGSQDYRKLNKPSLPAMYSLQAKPVGVVGAIVVESSSWIDDNLWYLDTCRADPFMVG